MRTTLFLLLLVTLFTTACSVGNEGSDFELDNASPMSGPQSGQILITITGKFFTNKTEVYLGSFQAEVESATDEELLVRMPMVSGGGLYELRVVQGSQEEIFPELFNVRGDPFSFTHVPFPTESWPLIQRDAPLILDLDNDGDLDLLDIADGTPIMHLKEGGAYLPFFTTAWVGESPVIPLKLDDDAFMDFLLLDDASPLALFGDNANFSQPRGITINGATPLGLYNVYPQKEEGQLVLLLDGGEQASLVTGHIALTGDMVDLVVDATLLTSVSPQSRVLLFDANQDSFEDILILSEGSAMLFVGDGTAHFSPAPPGAFPDIIPTECTPWPWISRVTVPRTSFWSRQRTLASGLEEGTLLSPTILARDGPSLPQSCAKPSPLTQIWTGSLISF